VLSNGCARVHYVSAARSFQEYSLHAKKVPGRDDIGLIFWLANAGEC